MPEARIELDFQTPLELLVAVILSAQCTDKRVNLTTPALFRRFSSAQAYVDGPTSELESLIKSCGFFRNKARNIQAAAKQILEVHHGEVPQTRAELEALPGVGRKTAGVVAIHLGSDFAFPVDTHVGRLSRRLGFTKETDPDKVEDDLQKLIPQEWWKKGHQLLVWHGRRTCFARNPACELCVVAKECPKLGVPKKAPKSKSPRARP
jgi:endonuclease III